MVRSFMNEFEKFKRRLARNSGSVFLRRARKLNGTILTGTLFAPVFGRMVGELKKLFGAHLKVLAVPNEYFGGDVSVAGLLTGGDFAAARDHVKGDFAIMPRVSLKSDEPIFLDGMRFDELQQQFTVPLHAFDLAGLTDFLSSEFPGAHAREAA
jgi:NifB/MoaA-like Fe-S oxidoreductase